MRRYVNAQIDNMIKVVNEVYGVKLTRRDYYTAYWLPEFLVKALKKHNPDKYCYKTTKVDLVKTASVIGSLSHFTNYLYDTTLNLLYPGQLRRVDMFSISIGECMLNETLLHYKVSQELFHKVRINYLKKEMPHSYYEHIIWWLHLDADAEMILELNLNQEMFDTYVTEFLNGHEPDKQSLIWNYRTDTYEMLKDVVTIWSDDEW